MTQKPIKFDLLVNGQFIGNLDELRAHFNSSIIALYRQGLLTKWLYHRDRAAFDALSALSPDLSDREVFWTIAKLIGAQPAEMRLDGQSVKNLNDLTDNFSVEIVDRFRSGELSAFLDKIGELEWVQRLAELDGNLRHIDLFEALCRLFNVEFDYDIAAMMLLQAGKTPDEEPPVVQEGIAISPAKPPLLTETAARALVDEAEARELVIRAETLTEAVAEILITHSVRLDDAFTVDEIAETHFPLRLTFVNLRYLRPEIARILAKFPGVLEFSALIDLTFEAAQYLSNRVGGVRMKGIRHLSYEAVSALIEERLSNFYPRFLDFVDLETLDVATARLFTAYKGDLGLGVRNLPAEAVELLAARPAKTTFRQMVDYPESLVETWHLPECSLYFPRLADLDRLTPAEARHLAAKTPATGRAAYPESLILQVSHLDLQTASELAKYGDRLVFAKLEAITVDVARALSRHRFQLRDNLFEVRMGSWLSFPALTHLSRECMSYFIDGQLHAWLAFDGLTSLNLDLAKEIAALEQSTLHLDGLIRLDPVIAGYLGSMVDVELHLNGLETIGPKTAQALCLAPGFICLFAGALSLADPVVCRIFQAYFPGYLIAKGFQWYQSRAKTRVVNLLYPAFAAIQQPIDRFVDTSLP